MNRRTGRPKNLRLRLALLERLPNETVGEIVRPGVLTRPQVSHYLRDLLREGLIEPHTLFSHLPQDGPGAKRYGLTSKGRHYRMELRRMESLRTLPTETTERKAGEVPARAVRRPHPRRVSGPSVQSYLSPRYVGSHNWNFVMVVESPFRRPFFWESSHQMRNGGWVSRHAGFGKGISLQESGGAGFDPAGAAGHKISVKFRIENDDPLEADRRARQLAAGVRLTLEREYGCQLSDPVLRSVPKHSVVGDPVPEDIRDAGVAVHAEVGVDDTPEPGTLEFTGHEAAERVRKYTDGGGRIGELADKVDLVAAKIDGLTGATEKMAESVGRLVDRLLQPETAQVRRDPGKVGPSEAIKEGFG